MLPPFQPACIPHINSTHSVPSTLQVQSVFTYSRLFTLEIERTVTTTTTQRMHAPTGAVLKLDWSDFAKDLQKTDAFGKTKKEEERQRLGLGGLDRRVLRRRRQQQ